MYRIFLRRLEGEMRYGGHVTSARAAADRRMRERMQRGVRMILGLGTDLIEIERIQASLDRFGERFRSRVFTAAEIAYCLKKKASAESFAARFAAKEAGAKALGTGISHGVSWKEIEVRRLPGQRPTLHWSGRAEELALAMGVRRTSLSLTHGREAAIAVVVIED
ncbi:MAG: holo-ACP synthase [Acidobacteriaceae bacterium]